MRRRAKHQTSRPGERPRLLEAGMVRRGRRRGVNRVQRWTIAEILSWADAHHNRTGKWPKCLSGRVAGVPFINWSTVDQALTKGYHGLPGGTTLARLLRDKRGADYRNCSRDRPLTYAMIRRWAKEHWERTGVWPSTASGRLRGVDEKWANLQMALNMGYRGLPGGSSIAKLLKKDVLSSRRNRVPTLSRRKILAWADAYHRRHGKWPTFRSGKIAESPRDSWSAVSATMRTGWRGLSPGLSLSFFLNKHRGAPCQFQNHQPLSESRIVRWADAFRRRNGRWPRRTDGVIDEQPADTWKSVDAAMNAGVRSLPGGMSLSRLLSEKRNARSSKWLERVTRVQILAWADDYHARRGKWPNRHSGRIRQARTDTWMTINTALEHQQRGMKGKITLAGLLARERGSREQAHLPRLSVSRIRKWARLHRRRTGQWPNNRSGPVVDAPGENWSAINGSLGKGRRGLPGGSSLHHVLTGDGGRLGRGRKS